MSKKQASSKKNRALTTTSKKDATRRPIEAGKCFDIKELTENGWNLLPYLKRQKWENFVQIKKLVYPNLVKELYENAYTDDSLKWIKSTVGGKSPDLTQEIISEAWNIVSLMSRYKQWLYMGH